MMEIEQALRVVAEKILGWEYQSSSVCAVPYYLAPPLEGLDNKRHINLFYLLTGNGMIELMEALKEGLWSINLVNFSADKNYHAVIGHRYNGYADTPQAALILAASKLEKATQ